MKKITVNEALLLKKELVSKINSLKTLGSTTSNITVVEDGVVVSSGSLDFMSEYSKLVRYLNLSQELNDVLSDYNTETKISSLVRRRKNLELLNNQLNYGITRSKEGKTEGFTTVGDKRVLVTKVSTAIVPVATLESMLKANKKEMNTIQSQIYKLNAQEIELSFDDSDI